MLNETNAQKDGVITRTERPAHRPVFADDLIITGPLVHIGRPWNKQARTICIKNRDFDEIDLTIAPDNFLPRSAYRPGDVRGELNAYRASIDEWPRQRLPGFWFVPEDDTDHWSMVCGEELRFYTHFYQSKEKSRKFVFFEVADGPVLDAVAWLRETGSRPESDEFLNRFGNVRLVQREPSPEEMKWIPRPLTSYFRSVVSQR